MPTALHSRIIISIKRHIDLFVLCLAALLCACGEQQDGMQSLASQDFPCFYAVGADATTQAYLCVGNTVGYYREYAVTGDLIPSGQAGMCVGESGRIHIGENTIVYTSSSDDYSSWTSQTIGAGISSFAATPNGVFLLQYGAAFGLYRYEKSSNSWVNTGKTSSLEFASKCLYSNSYLRLLVLGDDAGDTYVQELTTGTALRTIAYYPLIDTGSSAVFAEVDRGIYIGNTTQGLFLNDNLIGAGSGFNSYAVVSPSEIFAGNYWSSDPLRLFRLVGGAFVPELVFPGTSGTGYVNLWPVPPDHLIIGIRNSTESDGLYLYDFKRLSVKRLNSLRITALYSRAR